MLKRNKINKISVDNILICLFYLLTNHLFFVDKWFFIDIHKSFPNNVENFNQTF